MIGLQAASAGVGDLAPETIVGSDVYFRTKAYTCSEGSTHCTFSPIRVNCYAGDEAIGGATWAFLAGDGLINPAVANPVDHPVSTNGWRVVSSSGNTNEGYPVKVRVYCANTG